jgi:hypothetical protein
MSKHVSVSPEGGADRLASASSSKPMLTVRIVATRRAR